MLHDVEEDAREGGLGGCDVGLGHLRRLAAGLTIDNLVAATVVPLVAGRPLAVVPAQPTR